MTKSKTAEDLSSRRPVCLEFTNTMAWHASPHPEERLLAYGDLVRWAQGAGLLSASEARRLTGLAARRPAGAALTLRKAISLREAIYRILVASLRGESPARKDLDEINNVLRRLTRGAHIARKEEGFRWIWNMTRSGLDSPLGLIALSASELLVSPDLGRVGQCADASGCGWLFFDTSKNRSRRWCDVNDCGNRARQRRFQANVRKQAD